VTGASGVGKTTLVHALDAQRLPGLHCHYFDSVGVPPVTDMTAHFGSPQAWQQSTTERWITALVANDTGDRVALLEGQTRPSEVRAAAHLRYHPSHTGPGGAGVHRVHPGLDCVIHHTVASRGAHYHVAVRTIPEVIYD
jgi:hypothetical protein